MDALIAKSLLNSHSYPEYRRIVSDLLAEGKATGDTQSEALVHYSLLNETRMNRLQKTIVLDAGVEAQLKALEGEYAWLVLSEGWCGDAAQLLPIMHKMAEASPNIELKIVFRDANPELMNAYLTNGARSIPKMIVLDKKTGKAIASWGPRPEAAANLVREYKEEYGSFDENGKMELQLWYLHDKGLSTQREIMALLTP